MRRGNFVRGTDGQCGEQIQMLGRSDYSSEQWTASEGLASWVAGEHRRTVGH